MGRMCVYWQSWCRWLITIRAVLHLQIGRVSIYLEKDGKRVNAKSMMGMMSIGLLEGEEVKVTADGEREREAMESIRQFLKY